MLFNKKYNLFFNKGRLNILILFLILVFIKLNVVNAQTDLNKVEHLFSINHELKTPIRLTIDQNDNIYVTDAFQKSIYKYDASGNFIETISSVGIPISIAISNDNHLIVSDNKKGSILNISTAGSINEIFSDCVYPSSAAFDIYNNLYVVDSKQSKVFVMDLSGNIINTIGEGILNYPTGMAYDSKNSRIVVAEHGGIASNQAIKLETQIHIFDLQGTLIHSFGQFGHKDGQFSRIQGLTVDKWGRIFVVDSYQANISVFDEKGEFITKFGSFGKQDGKLNAPMDIVIDSKDRVWISSMNNGSIEIYDVRKIRIPVNDDNKDNNTNDKNYLLQNYPNPFSVGTWIPFALSNNENVFIRIYDLNGIIIRTFNLGYLEKGDYITPSSALYWDGTDESFRRLQSGIYFYEIQEGKKRTVKQMIFLNNR